MRLRFDNFISEAYEICNGIGQGASSSGPVYQFYNSPLLELVTDANVSQSGAFFDDAYFLTAVPTYEECDNIMRPLARGAMEWSTTHNSNFQVSKFVLLRMAPKKRNIDPIPFHWHNQLIKPVRDTKLLGIIIDDQLSFKKQAHAAAAKGQKYIHACNRLTKPTISMPHRFLQILWHSVALLKMTYCLDVWYNPVHTVIGRKTRRSNVGFLNVLTKVQRTAAILITGAIKTTATDFLDIQAGLLPLHLYLKKLCFTATL
ncbi:hypothetical protein C8J56DRAFT_1061946 [Mycena floridula]|nr:hypothetical protein C8J56DRAFT_1061946 [Mycena floridula]